MELIAKTFQGLEEVLAQELTELGANDVQIGRRMVAFSGDKEMMYRANFCLRTAVRILMPIKHFKATDADEVYAAIRSIEWKDYLDLDTTFSVDSVVYSQEFRHSKFVAYKVKDAIVDYFRETTGKRPNIRIMNPDIRLNIHIAETDCTLSLDSSGESLHLRGYRTASVEAPINEVMAAALIKLSGWQFDCDLIDPFCGSGTILVEAALMARNIHPGIFRKEFGFEKWKDFDRDLLDRIYNDDSEERDFNHKIYGYDLNLRAVEAALANAKAAGVTDCIEVKQQEMAKFTQPAEKSIMITNPPYGERITSPDLLGLYHTIGERLKHQFVGNDAWIISYKEECFQSIGMKPSVKIQLNNGALECEFRKYVAFDGKMQDFRAQGGEVKTDDERRKMGEKKRRKQGDFKSGLDNREKRGFNEEKREFDDERRERRSFDRERKPFDRDRKPFDRDRAPFDKNRREKRSFSPGGFEDEDPAYALLRKKHLEFQQSRRRDERQRTDARPKRKFDKKD